MRGVWAHFNVQCFLACIFIYFETGTDMESITFRVKSHAIYRVHHEKFTDDVTSLEAGFLLGNLKVLVSSILPSRLVLT